jgi:hypothetical protein
MIIKQELYNNTYICKAFEYNVALKNRKVGFILGNYH